jgi:hypothetical protein
LKRQPRRSATARRGSAISRRPRRIGCGKPMPSIASPITPTICAPLARTR